MKAFRVSSDYIEWAHGSAAGDDQPLAIALTDLPDVAGSAARHYKLVDDPKLVAEIADVAELYVGGSDNNMRAAVVRGRAINWLKERGLTVKGALAA